MLEESQIYPSASLLEDVGGLAEKHQLMDEHEEYPKSLMSRVRYDPETQEDVHVHVSQEIPSTRIFETVEHSYTHGDSRARGSYEDTSIFVPRLDDLHVEVEPVVHPGSMLRQEYTRDYMIMQEHTMVSDSSQRHAEMCSGIQVDALDCREDTHLVEHGDSSPLQPWIDLGDHLHSISNCMSDDGWRVVDQQFERLPLVVPDDWGSVMTIGEYLPWVLVDDLLVESLGLTKAYDTFQLVIDFSVILSRYFHH
jgi:hypothetical protein